jgi:hypothetical protein
MIGGMLLMMMLMGTVFAFLAAALLLAGLAMVFNWLLKRGNASVQSSRPVTPLSPQSHPVTASTKTESFAPVAMQAGPRSTVATHSFAGVFTAILTISAALTFVGTQHTRQNTPAQIAPPTRVTTIAPLPPITSIDPAPPIPPKTSFNATADATATKSTDALPNTPAERRRLLAEFAAQVGRLFGRSQITDQPASVTSGNAPVSLGESRNGEVVVFELTQPMVRQLLGDAAGDLLRDMQARLPQDIREGYALIPLGSSLGTALPPVPPRLAASGLSSLADSLVSILSADNSETPAPAAAASPPATPRPAWIENPPPFSRVVRITQVGNTSVEQERTERLTAAARQLLLEQASAENLSREYHAVIQTLALDPQNYLLTSPWLETEEADFGSASGTQTVTTEFHLVSLPQDAALQYLPGIRDQVRSLRTIGIAACTATFWLGLLALTLGSSVPAVGRRHNGWLNRLGIAAAGMLVVASVFLGTLVGNGLLAEKTADLLTNQPSLRPDPNRTP